MAEAGGTETTKLGQRIQAELCALGEQTDGIAERASRLRKSLTSRAPDAGAGEEDAREPQGFLEVWLGQIAGVRARLGWIGRHLAEIEYALSGETR